VEIEDFQVGFHVGRVGGAGQGNHAHVESKAKNNPAGGSAVGVGRSESIRGGASNRDWREQGKAHLEAKS